MMTKSLFRVGGVLCFGNSRVRAEGAQGVKQGVKQKGGTKDLVGPRSGLKRACRESPFAETCS